MKIKCPECEEVMVKEEEQHVCPSCDHTLTLAEAEELFDDGKLIGVLEEDDNVEDFVEEDSEEITEEEDKEEEDDDDEEDDDSEEKEDMKEEGFNGYANKETWASTVVAENEYSLLKKIKEAHKKEKLDEKFVKSLVEGAKEGDLSEVFESVDLEVVNWEEVSDHFTQVMKESEEIGVDVVNAIFADVELSEEQKDEVINIFETAIDIRVNEIKSGLLEDHEQKVEEAIKIKEAELEDKTSEYVDQVVEEWYEDNKIAIEDSLKVTMAESFLDEFHDLLTKHYIHVPEDRYDIVESLAGKVTDLETQLDESKAEDAKKIEKLEGTITEMKKSSAIASLTEGMVETEKERLADIAEAVEYKDKDQFVSEVSKLKEAFISKADTHLDEVEGDAEDKTEKTGIEADIAAALKL